MTKDPWLFWRGGWKLRCESLGSLRYFLHGLVERVGDIVQVIKGADKSRNGEGATLPPNGVLALFLEDKMTKDPWLFWRGGVEVEMWISGKSEVFPAWSSWKGRGHSAGNKRCRQIKKRRGSYPSSKWCFGLVFRRQDDKGPVVVLEGGVEVEMWISGKSEVFPAWSSWKGRGHSAGNKRCRQIKKRRGSYPSSKWCFCLAFRRQDDEGPVEPDAGPVLKQQKQPAVTLSQSRARSETPEAASSGLEPDQGQFWNTTSSQPVVCGLSGTSKPPKAIGCFAGGACLIEPITKDPLEGVLFYKGGLWPTTGLL